MTVLEFDTIKGIYAFQFQALETEFHSHPAIEILFVEEGYLQLSSDNREYQDLRFAVIDSNQKHKISGIAESIKVLMVEHCDVAVKAYLSHLGIILKNGVYVHTQDRAAAYSFEELLNYLRNVEKQPAYDERVSRVVGYLDCNEVEYEDMMKRVTGIAHLSESRLSHLFKENVGVSIKKYVLWCKLRATINQHLDEKEDLFTSLIRSGFYDHPHFSRAFKTMLGVKPSKAYNSRTVQF